MSQTPELPMAKEARFLHTCDDCAHFAEDSERCVHGYPTLPHRKGALPIVYCKEFELA